MDLEIHIAFSVHRNVVYDMMEHGSAVHFKVLCPEIRCLNRQIIAYIISQRAKMRESS